MATDNWIKDLREGLWAALDADPEFRRLTRAGTRYEFDRGLLKRLELEAGMCPVVSLAPQAATLNPIEERQDADETVTFNAQLATAGQDVGACEELLLAFADALENDVTRLSAQRSNRLVRINFEGIEFSLWPSKEAARPLWVCEYRLVAIYEPSS